MFSRALANAGGRRVAAWQGAKLWAGAAPVVAKATRGNAATYSTHISSGASMNTAHRAQAWPLGSGPRVASVAGSGAQGLHTSAAPRGLDEFFPRGTPEETSQSGKNTLSPCFVVGVCVLCTLRDFGVWRCSSQPLGKALPCRGGSWDLGAGVQGTLGVYCDIRVANTATTAPCSARYSVACE